MLPEGNAHPCPICKSNVLSELLSLFDVPVACNVLLPTKEQALSAKRGNIYLVCCNQCGHVFNQDFEPDKMEYDPDYDNSLHFSPKFQNYAHDLAKYLLNTYHLQGKHIIEIACGKGEFLSLICRLGGCTGTGFDPSYDQRQDKDLSEGVRILKEYFKPSRNGQQGDLICCRHALEHIYDPVEFLQTVRQAIKPDRNPVVFFEVPNVLYTLRDGGVWDIIYEHYSYFSTSSLKQAFLEAGFDVRFVYATYGDQFLGIEAIPSNTLHFSYSENDVQYNSTHQYAESFKVQYQKKFSYWHHQLRSLNEGNKKVVIWGGGSKGITFLNTFQGISNIEFVVDLNPHKQGRYVPVTGQRVVSPESLTEIHPDTVLIMNPQYLDEIQNMLNTFNVSSDVKLV